MTEAFNANYLRKHGFIRYARSSGKRDELDGNIFAAWLEPSKGIYHQNRPFYDEPEGRFHFFRAVTTQFQQQKKWGFALTNRPVLPKEAIGYVFISLFTVNGRSLNSRARL